MAVRAVSLLPLPLPAAFGPPIACPLPFQCGVCQAPMCAWSWMLRPVVNWLIFNTCCLGSLPTAPRPTCKVSGQSCAPDFSPAVLLPPSSLARLPTLPRGWAETSFQCPGTQVLRGGSICGPHIPSPLLHQLSPVGSHSSVCPRGDVWPSSTHFAYSLVYNEVLILLILLVENT